MSNPGVTTLAAITAAAQARADMVNSSFLSAAEWTNNVNSSYAELYDLLVQKFGNDYYVSTSSSIVTTGLTDVFALPTDFYKLLGVDLLISGSGASGNYLTLHPFSFSERNRYSLQNRQAALGRTNLRYRLNGANLWFSPLPASGQTIRLWYVPRLTILVSSSDAVDGVSGWEEYIVIDAAIKAMQKEESDVSILMAQKQAMVRRINEAAENRDAGQPATVADNSGIGGLGFGYPDRDMV